MVDLECGAAILSVRDPLVRISRDRRILQFLQPAEDASPRGGHRPAAGVAVVAGAGPQVARRAAASRVESSIRPRGPAAPAARQAMTQDADPRYDPPRCFGFAPDLLGSESNNVGTICSRIEPGSHGRGDDVP